MLKSKIKNIEVVEYGFFSVTLKITNINEEFDKIYVDTIINSLLVKVEDDNISSYKLIGDSLTNMVEKTTGALSGGVFKLDDCGAYFFDDETKENEEIFYSGSRETYTIYIGSFQINLKLTDNFEKKPTIEIVSRDK